MQPLGRASNFVLLAGAAAVSFVALAQDKPAATKPVASAAGKAGEAVPPEMEEMMKAMRPGPQHERLMKLAGDWTVETTMEMPGTPPEKSSGTATLKPALDGRFIHETGAGQSMGMPTQHFKVWGYNNGSKKYEAVWSWTLGTGMLYMNGESKDDGKTIEWKAWYDNESGVREEFKATTTHTDADHFSVKLHGGKMPDGSPGPVMIANYTRKK